MSGKRRYLCRGCKHEQRLFPIQEPATVRTGCDTCNSITTFVAYGSVAFHNLRRRSA